jgi:hypothetical protein
MTRPASIILSGLLLMACAIAALQILVFHNVQPAPDSIAYFEVADQIQRVGYAQALSLHWSPLYPLYLLAVRLIAAPPPARELLVTTVADAPLLVTLCGIVGAVFVSLGRLCFPDRDDVARAWLACACGLSIFFAFGVLRVGLRMPDALVTSLAMLAIWAWCQAMARDLDLRWSALAGLFSGLAFLARSNLLHWSLVVGAAACVLAPATRRARRWTAFFVFVVGLLAIAGPQVAVLSAARGHFTFGESGKLVFAETYGATWPAGHPAWPIRASGGDVRVFTDTRDLNFPGFYEPGREYDDAIVPFKASKALLTVVRSARATLFGYWSPSFALMWPLLWALWPACLFGIGGLAFFGSADRDRTQLLRQRVSWFLIASGSAGVAMHLLSFSLGYYLPPYLIPLFMGIYLAMLTPAPGDGVARTPRQRAAWIMAAGFCLVTVLSTASSLRRSDDRARVEATADTNALAAALDRLPATGGRRRIAVAGSWLGTYAIRLSNSQVTADIPDPATLQDGPRRVSALRALRDLGVVAILGRRSLLQADDHLVWTPVTGDWAIADIRDVAPSVDGTP